MGKKNVRGSKMRSLLLFDHKYHQKTGSSNFLERLLAEQYAITKFYMDFDENLVKTTETFLRGINGLHFDLVVGWQSLPPRNLLDEHVSFCSGAYFPMYDGAPPHLSQLWRDYYDFQIICFSRALHERLFKIGASSHYFQYFPSCEPIEDWGRADSIFYWERVGTLDLEQIDTMFQEYHINNLHVHSALDPECESAIRGARDTFRMTRSHWFPDRRKMRKKMCESAFYLAPRAKEGIGMSFLEAMASGRCVVANDDSTMNEYITHGKNGILYDMNNPIPLERFDTRLLQKNAREYCEKGRRHWEKQIPALVGLLDKKTKPRLNVGFDATVLAQGFRSCLSRTGIFRVAHCLLEKFLTRVDLNLFLYCQPEDRPALEGYCKTLRYPPGCAIIDESDRTVDLDVFFSPIYRIPQSIRKKASIKKFLMLYDCILLDHPEWFENAPQPWFEELTAAFTPEDVYFFISRHSLDAFSRHFPDIFSPKNAFVAHLAADESLVPVGDKAARAGVMAKYGIPKNKKYLLSLCTIEPRKNVLRSLEAFFRLLERNRHDDLVFVLAGAFWPGMREQLEKIPRFAAHRDQVVIAGYVDEGDLAALYSGATVFVYTSLYEGFGLPVVEAMRCGAPVIVSNSTSVKEIASGAAFLIDPLSVEAHVEAYETLLADGERRESLKKLSVARGGEFSWDKTAAMIIDRIRETCIPSSMAEGKQA